jgi:ribonuclease HIII
MDTDAPKKTSFTYELTEEQQEKLLGVMLGGNYRKREVPYSIWSIEGDKFNATLYQKEKHGKRKLCVQGSKAEDFVLFQLEPIVLGAAGLGYEKELSPELFSAHAGSDESGKGDYFGPLVVCCAYTDEKLSDEMIKLGVKDCKRLTDKAVLTIGPKLRQLLGADGFSVVKFGNAAYNRLYAKMRNINRMLAWAHGTAIEGLLEKRRDCNRVVVDQFAPTEAVILRALKPLGKKAKVEQRHKAESDIAVAAASVIAREYFVRDCLDMGTEAFGEAASGEEARRIPLGSSDAAVKDLAVEMVRKHGPVWLMNHVKAHFKTTDEVLAAAGFTRGDLPPEGQVTSAVANGTFNKFSKQKGKEE